jgi:hypothetical protein
MANAKKSRYQIGDVVLVKFTEWVLDGETGRKFPVQGTVETTVTSVSCITHTYGVADERFIYGVSATAMKLVRRAAQ